MTYKATHKNLLSELCNSQKLKKFRVYGKTLKFYENLNFFYKIFKNKMLELKI
jgi:hypothetical protein